MSKHAARKPLALAAILSTAVAGVLAAAPARATNYGVAASSPLTIADGSSRIQVVGGAAISAPTAVGSVAWSPKGDRFAYIDASGSVLTAKADGSNPVLVAAGRGDAKRAHVAWGDGGAIVGFSEQVGGGLWQIRLVDSAGRGVGTSQPEFSPRAYSPNAGNDTAPEFAENTLVFQRALPDGTKQVIAQYYDADGTLREHVVDSVTGTASDLQPTASAYGFVAYVKDVTTGTGASAVTSQQIFAVDMFGDNGKPAAPQQVTFTAADHTAPSLSPAGGTVAFVTVPKAGGAQTVQTASLTPTGQGSNTESLVVQASGDLSLAYETESKAVGYRFQGATRFETANLASQSEWRDNGDDSDYRYQATSAVLSRSDIFADALGGAALAAHKGGPLLLTATNTLDQGTAAELKRILAPHSTVYLLGGTGAISAPVEAAVRGLGFTVKRENGADRYQTAVSIADDAVQGAPTSILMATGDTYPDALSAGAAAANDPGAVVVLSAGDAKNGTVPAPTRAYLDRFAGELSQQNGNMSLLSIGGPAVKATYSMANGFYFYPITGADRFETSFDLAKAYFGGELYSVGVATGLNWPDALSGGALMGQSNGPLLLVDPAVGLTPAEAAYVGQSHNSVWQGYVFGGYGVLPAWVDAQVGNAIAGPLGFVTVNGPSSTAKGLKSAGLGVKPQASKFPAAKSSVSKPGRVGTAQAKG